MLEFYKGKRILVTGHTGFKGSWLCMILKMLGAEVFGYSLEPVTEPNLFTIAHVDNGMTSWMGDIRNRKMLNEVFDRYQPEIVFHLAAQPIVRISYEDPVYTYETNVMGTVNLLECIRTHDCVRSVLIVTTDKVYENKEWEWGYRENERLNGYDPYSNSKSCSELVTHSYKKSFFMDKAVSISTARAGNVIGGGDFARDRIVPDCVRAGLSQGKVIIRNPLSVRPFQHVLEPLTAYMLIALRQWEDKSREGCYNVGPEEIDCVTAGHLADLFCKYWGEGLEWENQYDGGPHEAAYLKLDCSRIKHTIGWKPVWRIEQAVEKTVEWTKAYRIDNAILCAEKQIIEYMEQYKSMQVNS